MPTKDEIEAQVKKYQDAIKRKKKTEEAAKKLAS